LALFARSFDELLQEATTQVVQQTRLTRISPGSKARAILEAINRNINEAYQTFDLNLARAFLSGATGQYLDFIGEMMGVTRAGIEVANVTSASRTIKFYVDGGGTFGSINNSASILLPAGTLVTTLDAQGGIPYRTNTVQVFPVGATTSFVSAQAVIPGSFSNVGAGVLNFHNYLGYADSANNTLLCTNIAGIFSGAEVESDVNYKFRIASQALSSERGNETAIRINALLVPGVADVITIPYFKGIGTYRLIIKSITPTVPQSLIDTVRVAIDQYSSLGIVPEVAKPKETGLSFTITIKYRKKLADQERTKIEDAITASLKDYVNGLDIGQDFIINEAVERTLSVSEEIKDIGRPGKPFDEIFMYKESKLTDTKIRNELIENLEPEQFERIIIEPSVSKPIKILRAN
jgi:uncharacterized phage protein gp47/JayE